MSFFIEQISGNLGKYVYLRLCTISWFCYIALRSIEISCLTIQGVTGTYFSCSIIVAVDISEKGLNKLYNVSLLSFFYHKRLTYVLQVGSSLLTRDVLPLFAAQYA